MKNAYRNIRKELKGLGISKAIAGNTTYNGTPVVLLRWNGREEYVSESNVDILYDSNSIDYLVKNFADANLKA